MSSNKFYLKEGDTRPAFRPELKNPDGSAYDLTGSLSRTLHIKLSDGTTLDGRSMTIYTGGEAGDGTDGIPEYVWETTDWDEDELVAGNHDMEVEVIESDGGRVTFPNDATGYKLVITDDIGQAS